MLARKDPLKQLYPFLRCLSSVHPYLPALGYLHMLLKEDFSYPHVKATFIKLIASIFSRNFDNFDKKLQDFLSQLQTQITTIKPTEGAYIAVIIIGAMLGFGKKNHIWQLYEGDYSGDTTELVIDSITDQGLGLSYNLFFAIRPPGSG
jgi:hypothetical protein